MTDPKQGVKTLGIKLPDDLHAQFALVAQLDGDSLTDAVLKAVRFYVESKKAEPDFAARAQAVLDEIERETAARRNSIQALFGATAPAESSSAAGKRKS